MFLMATVMLVAFALFPSSSYAEGADDTFACLNRSGPTVAVTGCQEYNPYRKRFERNTNLDLRTASWNMQTYPMKLGYPLRLSGEDLCIAGGMIVGTNDPSVTWQRSYNRSARGGNGAAVLLGRDRSTHRFIIDGMRIHNAWDAIRPTERTNDFVIRNTWMSHIRDDCLDPSFGNANRPAGLIEDSLFEGCFVFLSSRLTDSSGTPRNTIRIENNLVRLQRFPWRTDSRDVHNLHGALFKYDHQGQHLVLKNNIFVIEGPVATRHDERSWWRNSAIALGLQPEKLKECESNIILWPGKKYGRDFPGALPDPGKFPNCVKVLEWEDNKHIWENAKQDWINRHPKVQRLDGDPKSDPNAQTYGIRHFIDGGTAAVSPGTGAA